MEYARIERKLIPQFSKLSNLLVDQKDLAFALNLSFSKDNIQKQLQLKEKTYSSNFRTKLVVNLKNQYSSLALLDQKNDILSQLESENSFCVTTGHQLNIATGPVYFLIKIIQTIKLANELNEMYPNNKILPVFWMATEDHDLEEIKSVSIFGKKITWNNDQSGAVGRMSINHLDEVKNEILSFFETALQRQEIEMLLQSYDGNNLADATFKLVNHLFKNTDLIIINGDQAELKHLFVDTMLTELQQNFAKPAVQKQNEVLEQNGIKAQAFVRDINLFYLSKNGREKLLLSEKGVLIENIGDFTLEEIKSKLITEPQNFSPNVILRPLYQETILPNLVYTGGGGELSYWLQLKGVFETSGVTFPLLLQRNSVVFTNGAIEKKLSKLDIKLSDLFQDWNSLSKQWIDQQETDQMEETVSTTFLEFSKNLERMLVSADPTRKNLAELEVVKLEKQRTALVQRLIKEKKQKFDIELKQLEELQQKINPNGELMERSMNFLNYLGQESIQHLIDSIYSAISNENQDLKVIQY
jgi:bacillithiol synthase